MKSIQKIILSIIYLFAFTASKNLYAQKITINGLVAEASNGEPLASVAISEKNGTGYWQSNKFGVFSLSATKSPAVVRFSKIGYETKEIQFYEDSILTVFLKPNTLSEVEVRDNYRQRFNSNVVSLTLANLNQLPSIGGERDVLKAIATLPGVSSGSELSAGINVRGGSNDQNMFYLDGAPIYNTGHLFNFLSLFNPDALQKVDFYKSDFPVEYGGRLSSVTDVVFREGNKYRWEGRAEVGLISSKILLEGPLKKEKTSLLLAARSTYLDLLSIGKRKAVLNRNAQDFFGYHFYDLNFKISHTFNPNHKVYLSFYRGMDRYEVLKNSTLGINFDQNLRLLRNQLLSIRSYHVFNPRFFLQAGIHHTTYSYQHDDVSKVYNLTTRQIRPWLEPERIYTQTDENRIVGTGSIKDLTLHLLADWKVNHNLKIKWGGDAIRHTYNPINYRLSTLAKDSVNLSTQATFAWEKSIFADANINVGSRWYLNLGMRHSFFNDTKTNFNLIEPRLSLTYKNESNTLRMGMGRMTQYNHALIKGGEIVDRVVWVPSSTSLPPQQAWQYTIGWEHDMTTPKLNFSIGGFYRNLSNLSIYQYKLGDIFPYFNWQDNMLTNGKGWASGIETNVNKSFKKIDLNLNYTLSWSRRQFEKLNDNNWFNFLFDRRHIINFNGSYRLNPTLQCSFLWTYFSGQRYNMPLGRILANPLTPEYTVSQGINEGKYPDYHRFDLSISKKYLLSKNRYWALDFNIYNLYNRRNVYRLYPATEEIKDEQNRVIERRNVIKSVSLFPLLPSINISYKF
ncbi:MAG: TonB-dependent receptor plug domain-containing protein [Runella sp.]